MDKLIDKIFYKAQSIRLEADEKASIKANVMSFMRSNSAREMQPSPYTNHFSILVFLSQKKYSMSLAVLLILVLSGGTSLAAAGALPGDLLYTIKLNVNEEVESLLAVSTQASAEVNAKHAVARLKEAETLATTGKLTPQAGKELEQNFTASIDSLNKNTESLKESGDFKAIAQVSTNLEDGLNAHYAALQAVSTMSVTANVEGQSSTSDTSVNQDSSTNTKVMMMAPMAASMPASSTEEMSAKGKAALSNDDKTKALLELGIAENKLLEARAEVNATTTDSSSTGGAANNNALISVRINVTGGLSSLKASARLTLADQYVVLGKAALNMGQFDQAVSFFKKAESAADDAENVFSDTSGEDVKIEQTIKAESSSTATSSRSWFRKSKGSTN